MQYLQNINHLLTPIGIYTLWFPGIMAEYIRHNSALFFLASVWLSLESALSSSWVAETLSEVAGVLTGPSNLETKLTQTSHVYYNIYITFKISSNNYQWLKMRKHSATCTMTRETNPSSPHTLNTSSARPSHSSPTFFPPYNSRCL